jgi:hypothetical protein
MSITIHLRVGASFFVDSYLSKVYFSPSYKPEYIQEMDDRPNLLFRARHG